MARHLHDLSGQEKVEAKCTPQNAKFRISDGFCSKLLPSPTLNSVLLNILSSFSYSHPLIVNVQNNYKPAELFLNREASKFCSWVPDWTTQGQYQKYLQTSTSLEGLWFWGKCLWLEILESYEQVLFEGDDDPRDGVRDERPAKNIPGLGTDSARWFLIQSTPFAKVFDPDFFLIS